MGEDPPDEQRRNPASASISCLGALSGRLWRQIHRRTDKITNLDGMRGSAPAPTDVRLRSDEPKADQHQHAGQDGEQEAIGNAGRQVATD
jgi:hypothetical protein